MAQKFLIVVGDPTTAGGEAIEGDSGWLIEGIDGAKRPLVRVGNAVMCGQCGPTKVVQGAAFFLSDGAMAAFDGCLLACGHQMIAKMQRLCSVDVAESPQSAAGQAIDSQAVASFAGASATPKDRPSYALQFRAIDPDTNEPVASCPYILTREDGSTTRGTCDHQGMTDVIRSDRPERVSVHFVFISSIGNPIPRSDLL